MAKTIDVPEILYHVADESYCEGETLQSMYSLHGDEAYDIMNEKWPELGTEVASYHTHLIFFYRTIEEAKEHVKYFGGIILVISTEGIEDQFDLDRLEKPYNWVSYENIPSEYIKLYKN